VIFDSPRDKNEFINLRRLRMQTKVLARVVALACLAVGTVQAAPVTYDFTGVVSSSYGDVGTAIGNAVAGSFTYDSDAYAFGSVAYSVSTGTFSTSHSSYFHVGNGTIDEQFLEDTLPGFVQSGFFFGDLSGDAVSGSSIPDLNFDLSAWDYKEVRYNVWDNPASNPILGWSGTLTSIAPRTASVPEPATLLLLGLGLAGIGAARRRRRMPASTSLAIGTA
jgi:PEP-CTERM motif